MDKTRRRLGRGLEALLGPTSVAEARVNGSLKQIPLSSVRPNPYQPRHAFDEKALDELKTSLDQSGLLQPVIVRQRSNSFGLAKPTQQRIRTLAKHHRFLPNGQNTPAPWSRT